MNGLVALGSITKGYAQMRSRVALHIIGQPVEFLFACSYSRRLINPQRVAWALKWGFESILGWQIID